MTVTLSRYLNKTVFVSIPFLFEDGRCRPFRLLGVEIHGLWLHSDELTDRLHHEKLGEAPAGVPAFVPFAQIGAVLIVPPALPAPQNKPATTQNASTTTKAAPAAHDAKADTKSKASQKSKGHHKTP